MQDDEPGDRHRRRLWFNWPLALGIVINFGIWAAAIFWLFARRR
jgi:hypothetical protein